MDSGEGCAHKFGFSQQQDWTKAGMTQTIIL